MTKKEESDLLVKMMEFKRIGNEAVKRARNANKKNGIPNVFSRNGIIYYEMPNGAITMESPF
jgi:hypothetical protein